MRRYIGNLVHRCRDEEGVIEVVDRGSIRSLHFGTRPAQTSMDLCSPTRLVHTYPRAMLTPLALREPPSRALMIGLGGGCLARFLLAALPELRLDAVERRESVVEVAFGLFDLPRDERLRVFIGDGADFVAARDEALAAPDYDLVLVDAYDHLRMSASVADEEFFLHCAGRMTGQGVLAINLWNHAGAPFEETLQTMRSVFEGQVLVLPVMRRGNVIALGFRATLAPDALAIPRRRVRELEARYGLEFGYFLRKLRAVNGGRVERWLGKLLQLA